MTQEARRIFAAILNSCLFYHKHFTWIWFFVLMFITVTEFTSFFLASWQSRAQLQSLVPHPVFTLSWLVPRPSVSGNLAASARLTKTNKLFPECCGPVQLASVRGLRLGWLLLEPPGQRTNAIVLASHGPARHSTLLHSFVLYFALLLHYT